MAPAVYRRVLCLGKQGVAFLRGCHVSSPCLQHLRVRPCPSRSFFTSPSSSDSFSDEIFSLVKDDMKNVYNEIISILRRNIRSDHLFNITSYYYELLDSKVGITTAGLIFLAKAMNHHLYQNAKLTTEEVKTLAIAELLTSKFIIGDDALDEAQVRRNAPPTYLRWGYRQTAIAGDMIIGCCLSEAAKLKVDVLPSLILIQVNANQGLLTPFMHGFGGDDADINIRLAAFRKNCNMAIYVNEAIAKAGKATIAVEEIMASIGYNMGTLFGILDELKDLDQDLAQGCVTTPVLYAMEEHPELRELVARRFAREGDLDKLREFVLNSKGVERTKRLMSTYHRNSLRSLALLADSPYRSSLEAVVHMGQSLTEDSDTDSYAINYLGTEGY